MKSAFLNRAALTALTAAVALTAAGGANAQGRDPDPFEGTNRRVFAFNSYLDRTVLRPAALTWKRVVPGPLRSGLRNFMTNLSEPVVFANDVLQGRAADASVSAGRFVINSTVGVGGLVDVGKKGGLPRHDNSFGLTLGRVAKAGPGPYIYLPVLGPTTLRDGTGTVVDILFNPLTWIRYRGQFPVGIGLGVTGGLNARADADRDLEALRAQATDEYATLRSLYLQNRQAQVTGKTVDVDALPEFDDPRGATAPAAPGSVSPTGSPPRPSTAPIAPQGDAAALPRPSGPSTATPRPRDDGDGDSDAYDDGDPGEG